MECVFSLQCAQIFAENMTEATLSVFNFFEQIVQIRFENNEQYSTD